MSLSDTEPHVDTKKPFHIFVSTNGCHYEILMAFISVIVKLIPDRYFFAVMIFHPKNLMARKMNKAYCYYVIVFENFR